MYIIFDTETTGLPKNFKAPLTDFDNWPRLVQLAWQKHDSTGALIEIRNYIIKPDNWEIPPSAEQVHGISNERAIKEGKPLSEVLEIFSKSLETTKYIVGHNINFDLNIVGCEYLRTKEKNPLEPYSEKLYDTSTLSTEFCKLEPMKRGKYKWPKLGELYLKLFNEPFVEAHDAAYDVEATARSFFALAKKQVFDIKDDKGNNVNPNNIKYEAPKIEKSNFYKETVSDGSNKNEEEPVINNDKGKKNTNVTHLHIHTDYSSLRSSNELNKLVAKAKEFKMKALAITDFGTLSGAFQFVELCNKQNILPIIGCELHWSTDYKRTSFTQGAKDERYSIILLAKNQIGYQNLCKLSSIGLIEGFYFVPRVSKKLIEKHKEGLIALSGNLKSEVPYLIYNKGKEASEKAIEYWHSVFGDDFYLQINRLGVEGEEIINKSLLEYSNKYNIKTVACNESYYLNKEDSELLDVLYCIKTGNKLEDYKKKKPWGNNNDSKSAFYFMSKDEMIELFKDIPECIDNIDDLVSKVEKYELRKEVKLPNFDIPKGFDNEDDYLNSLTFEGAEKRYETLSDDIKNRIDFELNTIKKSGYSGYFLIVQDFISKARESKIDVGPGRGSAAGSVVAYALNITNVDPLKYGLLFERFLNPDRVSLPDIDIDFDDTKRGEVINYVISKYGKENVCQIITFGRLKIKSAIKDVGRALDLSFAKTTKLAEEVTNEVNDNESITKAIDRVGKLKKIVKDDNLEGKTLKIAAQLEGLIRNPGVHACGVIIAPKPISDIVPITIAKDADLWLTQYDTVEEAGLLKMDILGLKTLSIIRDAINYIYDNRKIDIDLDTIPLDDSETLSLFQKGLTNGIFQFESEGMRRQLMQLKPDKFEDLIAMNALYRPGPLQYIPSFIRRKHGREKISYDLPEMEEILKETYGITVYQEQVMLLSQKLAGFSGGEADTLRKAMGKKNKQTLAAMQERFEKGCGDNGYDSNIVAKIWIDWEEFANYAFNKSHSTCYALLAYQTAYLKAHYTEEFMTSVMKHNSDDLKKVSALILDSKKMGIKVLPPNVNHSMVSFSIEDNDKNKCIRFGLEAVKGIGEYMSEKIVQDRKENGIYKSLYDFCTRDNIVKESLKTETIKRLVRAGIFDNLNDGIHRKQLLNEDGNFIEKIVKNAEQIAKQKKSKQLSLFTTSEFGGIEEPKPKVCKPYTQQELEQLEFEQFGAYLTSHPLDEYRWVFDYVLGRKIEKFNNISDGVKINKKESIRIGGVILEAEDKLDRNGKKYLQYVIADYFDKALIRLYDSNYNDNYNKYRDKIEKGEKVLIDYELSLSSYSSSLKKDIISVRKLSTIQSSLKSITIEINTQFVSDDKLNYKLVSLLRDPKYSGKTPLYIAIYDDQNQMAIKPKSKSIFLNISENFISELETIKSNCNGDSKINIIITT